MVQDANSADLLNANTGASASVPPFESILFPYGGAPQRPVSAPPYFSDLNLDQAVAAITRNAERYDLTPFFYAPLSDARSILARQEVMRDLERPELITAIDAYAAGMQRVRDHLERRDKLRHAHQKQRWFLDAAATYCEAHRGLAAAFAKATPRAGALCSFTDYLSRYLQNSDFDRLAADAEKVQGELSALRYCVEIDQLQIYVRKPQGEPDYAADVEACFQPFQEGAGADYPFSLHDAPEMDHVEAQILDRVALLYPEAFAALENFAAAHDPFIDPILRRFDREVQFYCAYLRALAPLKASGLAFCYPEISTSPADTYLESGFDLTLAQKLAAENALPVANDFSLHGGERILVVTGPNQGGKTTFARMLGQAHYLAALGCPIPGVRARLLLCDRIFTHFERGEANQDLRGKLEDDLLRIHAILEAASAQSLVLLNEIFTSTTLEDATKLSQHILARLKALGLIGVWVTFVEDVAAPDPQIVSMVSVVEAEDPTKRTFKILRGPAEGRSRALSLARKHGLTAEQISERLSL